MCIPIDGYAIRSAVQINGNFNIINRKVYEYRKKIAPQCASNLKIHLSNSALKNTIDSKPKIVIEMYLIWFKVNATVDQMQRFFFMFV